jgi:hypothetical protein
VTTQYITSLEENILYLVLLTQICSVALGGEVKFATKPSTVTAGGKVKITFAVSAKTDVEVAILDSKGKVVRHLAAGVIGAEKVAHCTSWVISVPVRTPFPDVSVHVEETPRVGRVLTDVAGLADSALVVIRPRGVNVVPVRQAYSHSDSVGRT